MDSLIVICTIVLASLQCNSATPILSFDVQWNWKGAETYANSVVTLASKTNVPSANVIKEKQNFLARDKRDVVNCPVPSNWPTLISELNSVLNATTSLALLPQPWIYTAAPTDQPTTCPSQTGSWWPGSSNNLRSTCPWIYKQVDLGESFYPRYVLDADCLCNSCVNANVMGCQKLRQDVTVFRRGACKDGLAVMAQVKYSITVGCYCTSSVVQTSLGSGPTSTQ
ncbi:uncharacterized protein LOC129921928 [Biomphalaria glabrata]|uniref:Uncharacterized protein LOC129921928 n=1 Tax=Biomphalaria glabrata TaxID=6526 RepID=A0A9W2YF31_BIOGL|nr:uncharacterized protein LOC129921928 [Biomphalaria glabrata]KAI8782707.1 hypothetical protein BgiBS90_016194 [Biomphalaria glabrata]